MYQAERQPLKMPGPGLLYGAERLLKVSQNGGMRSAYLSKLGTGSMSFAKWSQLRKLEWALDPPFQFLGQSAQTEEKSTGTREVV